MNRRRNPDEPVRIRLAGFGKPRAISPAVEAFIRDLFDASYPNPLGGSTPTERILSGIEVLVDVVPEHNGVHIDRLRALTRKQGEGTKAMRFLTSLADKHGVKLSLYAKPFGSETMNRDTLVNFYRRFGFYPDEAEEEDEGTEMYRWPRRPNPARKSQHVYHLTYASDLPFIARQGLVPRADTEAAWDNEPGVYFVNVLGYEAGAPESEEPAWLRFPAPAGLPPRFFTGMNEAHANVVFPASSIDVWVDARGRPVSKSDKGRWKPLVEVVRTRANPARKPSQTDTPTSSAAFQRWFGASKVVNAKGEPRVMYHGTHADFDVFDTTGGRRARSFGAMFTPSKAYAANYGRKEYGGKVLAVYLRIENPFDAKNKKHDREWEANRLPQEGWVQYAHRAGYDGAITMLNEYVVFDPTQVKSATANAGTFDPADPSILRNPARKPSQTDTPTSSAAFRRWFGASKVVDAKGQPLVVYHGTPVGGFDTFATQGNGIFFSDDPKVAWSYTVSERKPRVLTKKRLQELQGREVGQDTPALYASYLRMENPLVVDAEGSDWQVVSVYGIPARVRDAVREAANDAYASTLSTDQLVEAAQALGYDGVIVERTWDLGGWGGDADHPSTIYAVLDPKQVKSANMNAGTFDPADPSILRNPARKAKPPTLAEAGLPEVWFHGTQKTFGKLKAQGGACVWLADKAGAMAYATPSYGRRSAIRLIEVTLSPDTRVVDLADASDPAVREFIRLDASVSNMRWHGREDVTDAEMADAVARWNARRTHYDAIEARSWAKAHFRKAGADALLVRDVAGWGGHEAMPSLCLLNPKKVLGERDVAPDLALVRPENMPKHPNPRASRRKVTR